MDEVTRPEAPDFVVGDVVAYDGDPENTWRILNLREGVGCWWAFAEQHGTKQNFPAGVFSKIAGKAPKKVAPAPVVPKVVTKKRKDSVSDPVAALLSEADNIAACWRIAEMAGLDMVELRTKIGHLSNGLQRMGIGNRLRKSWKEGNFDPLSIICLGVGDAANFAYRADHPEFEGAEE